MEKSHCMPSQGVGSSTGYHRRSPGQHTKSRGLWDMKPWFDGLSKGFLEVIAGATSYRRHCLYICDDTECEMGPAGCLYYHRSLAMRQRVGKAVQGASIFT